MSNGIALFRPTFEIQLQLCSLSKTHFQGLLPERPGVIISLLSSNLFAGQKSQSASTSKCCP